MQFRYSLLPREPRRFPTLFAFKVAEQVRIAAEKAPFVWIYVRR